MKRIILWHILACLLWSYDIFSSDYSCEKDIELKSFDLYLVYRNNNLKQFLEAVEVLHVDINQIDHNGFSLAHLAAREGKIDWLAVLNWLKADLEEPDQSLMGWPPIAWAISAGQKNAVQLLLHYGVPLVVPSGQKR